MNFIINDDEDMGMKIIDNTMHLVSTDLQEKLAYSYCIL